MDNAYTKKLGGFFSSYMKKTQPEN